MPAVGSEDVVEFVVIGGGVAGLRAAIALADAGRVLVLTKAEPAETPSVRAHPPASARRPGSRISQPRRVEPATHKDLHLAELLDFRPDQGIIRLHDQRVVIVSAAAMGLLRKELIDTLGLETARRVAIRFGFADGYLYTGKPGWYDNNGGKLSVTVKLARE